MSSPRWKRFVEGFVSALGDADFGKCENLFADAPQAAGGPSGVDRRRENLRRFLLDREKASILLVGEAAGFRGMRWTGIPFTSERQLLEWGVPFCCTSDRPGGWAESSASVVQSFMRDAGVARRVLTWNVVPAHPHVAGVPLSNRTPSAREVELGIPFLAALVEALAPKVVVAAGRTAESALTQHLALTAEYVRHPANGGAAQFCEGMRRCLGLI